MHTSAVLTAEDFTCALRLGEQEEWTPTPLSTLFPEYHPLDRIGVVSPRLEEGIAFVGVTVLALTTAFYDLQRQHAMSFFDYPHHFALLGDENTALSHSAGLTDDLATRLEATWGNLDVWPDTNWQFAPPTATAMLRLAFSLQINRLFWPERLEPAGNGGRLPAYARQLLCTRLKSVHLYGSEKANVGIQGSTLVGSLLENSLSCLPVPSPDQFSQGRNLLRRITPEEFLDRMAECFAG